VNTVAAASGALPLYLLPDVTRQGEDGWNRTIAGAKVDIKGRKPPLEDVEKCFELLCLHGAELPVK
jgi:hypothetical protein